ncbi:MBL fold metallo-hydrolase [Kutzneria kofuensis]|uniref:Glyoxylase-like metal-dependent hydrolase (Beta-lactamase superfamily II) n=1 Tax=Kutzneria kofuensis TaxID=103725 RepID=A0A7W9KGA3_9PSEU|nr:MBL fold metallo-hydrolase [Kutzneria kofuensis]MBB5892031.1 glyoxylase-like metal-dependent hydrolase (beta-lactamase superfamily II) [Kutzneria kofuensis]
MTWYVDDRCTNCDVARQFAPELIGEVDGRSAVIRQPETEAELRDLHAAGFACLTRSIRHTSDRLDPDLDPFPMALDDDLFHCGHNSRHTAGANSFLLRRSTGNLMIDTPRWSPELADRYERLGPVSDVLLTHRDHAAHGRQYADRYGARLWIHEADLDASPDADQVIRGLDPVEITPGVVAHPFPGHTEGSVLYVADDKYCFTGDSFYWSRSTGDLAVAEAITWYDIRVLAASLARTAPLIRFEWVLPGHGDRMRRPADEMAARLAALADRTALAEPRPVDFTAMRW